MRGVLSPRARPVQGRSLPHSVCAAPRRCAVPSAACERAACPRGAQRPTKPREVHGFKPKRKDITMSNTSKLPSHRVYAVTKNG
jgi:hypothetical protein